MENISTEVDIYLAVSLSITVITTTSYLCGTMHVSSVRQQYLLNLRATELYMAGTYHPAKQSKRDLAAFSVMGGRKSNMGQLGKDNNSESAKIILRGFFPFEFPWVEVS